MRAGPRRSDDLADAVSRFRGVVDDLERRPPQPVDELPAYLRRHPELVDLAPTVVRIGGDVPVPARLFAARGVRRAAFVWVHGGSFIGGDLGMPESWWPALALARRGVAVLAIDYRKALHGVRFPAMSDDVIAAWRWAVAAEELSGVPISLGGASAGGCLAAGAASRLAGHPDAPDRVVLAYPTLHSLLPDPSAELVGATAGLPADRRFPPEVVAEMGRTYTGGGEPPLHAFPGDDPVPPALPATLVIDSEADDLRASGEAYARTLRAAGVPCVYTVEPGTMHGHLNTPDHPGAERSVERIATWLLEGAPPATG